MAASSSTANLNLPIFEDDDKPSWRGDFNAAMQRLEDQHNMDQARINELTAQLVTIQTRLSAGGL